MRLLFLDIENSPAVVHAWSLWKVNVGLSQIIDSPKILCWCAKWLGEKEVFYADVHDREDMTRKMHALLDEADAVCTFNGNKHDLPHINREFIEFGLKPPSPYRKIDLLLTARKKFKFLSNRLAYLAKALGIGTKQETGGHQLWIDCMADDPKAWKKMASYCRQDVLLLEKLYKKMLPWIEGHPNVGLYTLEECACSNCGSTALQRRGHAFTNSFRYQRYQCLKCGTWGRSAATDKPTLRNKLVAAV